MQSQMRLHAEPEDDAADLPLPALFDRASRLHALASSSPSTRCVPPCPLFWEPGSPRPSSRSPRDRDRASGAYALGFSAAQDGIRTGVDLLRHCDEMVSKLGLFSPNETKEDVSTANLKYLLVCPFPSLSLCSMYKSMKQVVIVLDAWSVLFSCQSPKKSFIQLSVQLQITPGQFYSVISTHANHALSVLFSCQYNCKSRLVSFIQLSVQLQITTVLVNLRIVPVFHKFYFLLYTSDLCLHSQVPYYLAEMTEKIAQEDRIPVLKASQDHLKVIILPCHIVSLGAAF